LEVTVPVHRIIHLRPTANFISNYSIYHVACEVEVLKANYSSKLFAITMAIPHARQQKRKQLHHHKTQKPFNTFK